MKECQQWNPVYEGSNSRLLDQQASAWPTELPGLLLSGGKNSVFSEQIIAYKCTLSFGRAFSSEKPIRKS